VHVNNAAEDQLLLAQELHVDGNSREIFWENVRKHSLQSKPLQMRRKPLQVSQSVFNGGQQPLLSQNKTQSQLSGHSSGLGMPPRRKHVDHKPVESATNDTRWKIFGPRPLHHRLRSVDNAVLQSVSQRQNIDTRRWSEQIYSSRTQTSGRWSNVNATKPLEADELHAANDTQSTEPPASAFRSTMLDSKTGVSLDSRVGNTITDTRMDNDSLTLIRRHGGTQANVGRILRPPKEMDSNAGISIEISTFGYRKFVRHKPNGTQESQVGPNFCLTAEEQTTMNAFEFDDQPFRRHIRTSSNEHGSFRTHLMDSSASSNGPQMLRTMLGSGRHRQHNYNGFQENGYSLPKAKTAQPKAFSFRSPWDGVCEFSSGLAGRSVKCKHRWPSNEETVAVSELRFNLPTSKTFGSPAPKSSAPGIPREPKQSSFFSSQTHQQSSPHSGPQDVGFAQESEHGERLDLSLGQEHAGGGFGGKQAKLGKLIVASEGLQMLDLVVAANMAVWWRVYDRLT